MTEPRTPGEHRLAQLAEPEKEVAAGTRTLVVGPYLTRRRRARPGADSTAGGGTNPRLPEARLEEAVGLAGAIDLNIVQSLIAPLASPRPATYIGSGKVEELGGLIRAEEHRPGRDGLRAVPGAAAQPGERPGAPRSSTARA